MFHKPLSHQFSLAAEAVKRIERWKVAYEAHVLFILFNTGFLKFTLKRDTKTTVSEPLIQIPVLLVVKKC